MHTNNLDPKMLQQFRQIWTGFYSARILITANNFRIFEYTQRPITSNKIASFLKTDKRATKILLDALVSIGMLDKKGNLYCNSELSKLFLVSNSPYYHGDILRHANSLWDSWSELDKVVKTGKPSKNKRDYHAFILGMHNIAKLKVTQIIDAIDLAGYKSVIDIGGGPGTYSMEFAKRGLEVSLFDYADTLKIARRLAKEANIKGIHYIAGDITTDNINKSYDVIFISQLLHAYDGKTNQLIIKKAARALNAGGIVVIQEFYIDETMTMPLLGALFSVNMLVNTKGGRCYTVKEMSHWCQMAGLKDITAKHINDAVLIIAKK